MKNSNHLTSIITLLIFFSSHFSNAQFELIPGTGVPPEFGRTIINPLGNIRGISFGNLPNGTATNSVVDINSNFIAPSIYSPLFNLGEVFRTDCPDLSTYWRMLRYETPQAKSLEYGTIYNLNSIDDNEGYHFYLQSSYSDDDAQTYGDLRFNTGPQLSLPGIATPRMRIFGPNGFMGIGNYLSFIPRSLLHQHFDSDDSTWHRFTNRNTGINAYDGLKIGIEYNGLYAGNDKTFAKIIHQEDAPLKIYTANFARMLINAEYTPTIHSVSVNTSGYVGIGQDMFWNEEAGNNGTSGQGPRSLLHLQGPNVNWGGLGWRKWNKTGIYLNEYTDEMYIGLKNRGGNNRSDAVIMWGDDQYTFTDPGDCFRIIFSGACSNGGGCNGNTNPRDATTLDGLETMRITPSGYIGIGPLFTTTLLPARRIEILDVQNRNSPYTSLAEPQLRLTFTQASAGNPNTTGVWTDFQTTGAGDLYMHPSASGSDRHVGINTLAPGNTLEIKTAGTTVLNTGQGSGLRFSNMNNTVTPQTNPDPQKGVLSVDNNGDVIFVVDEDNGGTGTGDVTACTASGGTAANFVTKWTSTPKEICVSQVFDDGTGVSINAAPFNSSTKLTLRGLQASSAGTPATSINSIFMDANNNDLLQIRDNGTVLIGNGIGNTGSFVDGQLGIGGGFGSPISSRLEIHGSSGGLGRCIEVDDNSSNALFYVYDNGRVGISTNAPNFPLDVQAVNAANVSGNFTGDIIANGWTSPSDSLFKNNISNIGNSLSIINQLIPHQYNYDTLLFPQMHFNSGTQYGMLAQELEQVLPELIGTGVSPLVTDSNGIVIHQSFPFKTINYTGLIPFLVGAIKAQNQSIDSMRTGMMAMQTQIDNCCNAGNRHIHPNNNNEHGKSIDLKLINAKAIILNQNVPNPFAEQTSITYFINDEVKSAVIYFYDNKGVILKTVEINEKGAGQIKVFAADLSSGAYTYSLIADGKLIETKKMVKMN